MTPRTPAGCTGDEPAALRELRALLASAGHAGAFPSLVAYRFALIQHIAGAAGQAAKVTRALLNSDAYAITFQSIDGYRRSILETITNHLTPHANHQS